MDWKQQVGLVVLGWFLGFISTRAHDRQRRRQERSAELRELFREVARNKQGFHRMKRARDIRAVSELLGSETNRHTEEILDLWKQVAAIENSGVTGVTAREEASILKADLLAQADEKLELLMKRLRRKAR